MRSLQAAGRVARQTVALGRTHAGRTVTIDVTDTELVVACDDGSRTIRRTTGLPIRNLETSRPVSTKDVPLKLSSVVGLNPTILKEEMQGASAPRAGTGTVFVRELHDGEFTAIWQGDDEDPQAYVDIDGSRSEVLAWVGRCRPATFLALDRSRDEYVPFTIVNGTIGELPF